MDNWVLEYSKLEQYCYTPVKKVLHEGKKHVMILGVYFYGYFYNAELFIF